MLHNFVRTRCLALFLHTAQSVIAYSNVFLRNYELHTRFSVRISAGTPAILTEANTGTVSRFLSNPFQFIIHQSLYHSTVYSQDTDGFIVTQLEGKDLQENITQWKLGAPDCGTQLTEIADLNWLFHSLAVRMNSCGTWHLVLMAGEICNPRPACTWMSKGSSPCLYIRGRVSKQVTN
jgi:hypothetical protein